MSCVGLNIGSIEAHSSDTQVVGHIQCPLAVPLLGDDDERALMIDIPRILHGAECVTAAPVEYHHAVGQSHPH